MRFFLLSPTFFSFLAGTFISTATTLWIGVLLTPPSHPLRMHLAGVGFALAALGLLVTATTLEGIRSKAAGSDLMAYLRDVRSVLWFGVFLTILGMVGGIIGIIFGR